MSQIVPTNGPFPPDPSWVQIWGLRMPEGFARSDQGLPETSDVFQRVKTLAAESRLAEALEIAHQHLIAVQLSCAVHYDSNIRLPSVHWILAKLYLASNQPTDSLKHSEAALLLLDVAPSPSAVRVQLHCLRSRAHLMAEDFSSAYAEFQAAFDGGDPAVPISEVAAETLFTTLRGLLEAESNLNGGASALLANSALDDLNRIVEIPTLSPNDRVEGRYRIAAALVGLELPQKAIQQLQLALGISVTDRNGRYYGALARFQLAELQVEQPLAFPTAEELYVAVAEILGTETTPATAQLAIHSLHRAADAALRDDDRHRAGGYVLRALGIPKKVPDDQGPLELLALEGVASRGLWAESVGAPLPHFVRAEKLATELYGPLEEVTRTWFSRRALLLADTEPEQAIAELRLRLSILPQSCGERVERLLDLAFLAYQNAAVGEQVRHLDAAFATAMTLTFPERVVLIQAHHFAGQLAEYRGDEEGAFKHYRQAVQEARASRDMSLIAERLRVLGELYLDQNDLDSALNCFQKAEKTWVEGSLPTTAPEYFKFCQAIIDVFLRREEFEEALSKWIPAYENFKTGGGADRQSEAIFNGLRALIAIGLACQGKMSRKSVASAWTSTDIFLAGNKAPAEGVRDLMLRTLSGAVELAEKVGDVPERLQRYRDAYANLAQIEDQG